jgi:hypothetical protein
MKVIRNPLIEEGLQFVTSKSTELTDLEMNVVTIPDTQTITGQKQINNDFILQSGRKLIFDG